MAEQDWHPALDAGVRDRPVVREALHRDADLLMRVQLLNLFLHTLNRHMPDRWLADRVVADLLPSDREVLDAHQRREQALREISLPSLPSSQQLYTFPGDSTNGGAAL